MTTRITDREPYWCPVYRWTPEPEGDQDCDSTHRGPCADGDGPSCSLPFGSCDICTGRKGKA